MKAVRHPSAPSTRAKLCCLKDVLQRGRTGTCQNLRRWVSPSCAACALVSATCRLQQNGEQEVRAVQNELSDHDAQAAALQLDIREKGDQIEGLKTEKELQSGGEVRELTALVDDISKRWGRSIPRGGAQSSAAVRQRTVTGCSSAVVAEAWLLQPRFACLRALWETGCLPGFVLASAVPRLCLCPCPVLPPTSLPLPCSVVKNTSSWNNKKELLEAEQANCEQLAVALAEVDEEGMRAKMQQASQERDEAQSALNT